MLKLAGDEPKATIAWQGKPRENSFDSVFGSPFVEGDYIYGTNSDGELVCMEVATGKRVWKSAAPNVKKNRSADVFLIKNGERFFLWTEKGDLIIAKLSPKEYKEIDRVNLLKATSSAFGRQVLWSHPAFANKCFFAKNDQELICVSLAESSGAQ
jgi:outer membrane protein assembly factor BamB